MQKYQIINASTGEYHSCRSYFAMAVKRAQKLANQLNISMAVTDKDGLFHLVNPTTKTLQRRNKPARASFTGEASGLNGEFGVLPAPSFEKEKVMICECCGQEKKPTLSVEEYNARAIPRLAAIDRLAEKINFATDTWRWTPEGERYERLMREQSADEVAAGL